MHLFLNIKKKARLCFLLIIPYAFIYTNIWLNKSTPTHDAAYYLATSLSVFQTYEKSGTLAALSQGYRERFYKPTLTPILSVPFYILSNGNTLWSRTLYALFFSTFLIFGIYRLFKIFLKEETILATAIFSTLPPVVIEYGRNWQELSWLAIIFTVFSILLRPNIFKLIPQSIMLGTLVGIAICIRPVLTVLTLLPPFLYVISNSNLPSNTKKLTITIFTPFLGVAACGLLNLTQISTQKALLLSMVGAILIAVTIRKIKSAGACLSVFLSGSIALIWHGPFLTMLTSWVIFGGFGEVGKLSGGQIAPGWTDYLSVTFSNNFGYLGFALFGLGATLAIMSRAKQLNKKMVTLLSSVPIVFIFGLITTYNEPRFAYFYSWVILIVSLVIIFQSVKRPIRLTGVIMIAAMIQSGALIASQTDPTVFDRVSGIFRLPGNYLFYLERPIERQEKQMALLQELNRVKAHGECPRFAFVSYSIGRYFPDLDQLDLFAKELNFCYELDYPVYDFSVSSAKDVFELLKPNYDYILLGPVSGKPDLAWQIIQKPFFESLFREIEAKRLPQIKSLKNLEIKMDTSDRINNYYLIPLY